MSDARRVILERLRAAKLEPAPLPPLTGDWTRYPDLVEQFCSALSLAAGSAVKAPGRAALGPAIDALPAVRAAARRCSVLDGVTGNVDAASDIAELVQLDVFVGRAELGVAESGAVWLAPETASARAACFLAQHVVLALPSAELVHHLHDAYARLGERVARQSFGCFMTGPSKTADIEQALVIGAQGPRSLTVVLY